MMSNLYFPDDEITTDDLYFVCSMIERVARQLKQPNRYVVNAMGHDEIVKKLSLAGVLHCDNPLSVAKDWIDEYNLSHGGFDVENVNPELCKTIPSVLEMGKVYMRLMKDTMQEGEDYADAMLRVYNNEICDIIDNYNSSAYYEPSAYLARCYFAGTFN